MFVIRTSFLLFFLFSGIVSSGCQSPHDSDIAPEDLKPSDFLSNPSNLRTITPLFEIAEGTSDVEFISLKVQLYDTFYTTSANLIILGNGETLFVDYSKANFMEESILPYLRRRGIQQIDHLITTHFHKGNVDVQRGSGLDALMTQFSVKKIYSAPLTNITHYASEDKQIIRALVSKAQELNITWDTISAGDELSLWEGKARLEILSDYNHEAPEPSTLNLRFEYQDFSILFLQSTRNEDVLELAIRQSNLASTVLVLPHSPPDYHIYAPLYESIDPVMIIIPFRGSFFDSNEANIEHLQFLQNWKSRGVSTLPANWFGNIVVQTDGKTATYYTDREILLANTQPDLSLFTDVSEEAGLDGNQSIGIWGK